MKIIVLAAIRMYQRFLSPIKGFSCAYRLYAGGESCSAYGYRVIGRYGIRTGVSLLRRRLGACSHVQRQHAIFQRSHNAGMVMKANFQAGFCDVSCDGCDLGMGGCDGANLASSTCDILGNCGSCDFGSWGSSRKKDDEKWVKIGPYSNLTQLGNANRPLENPPATHTP
jgi:uncharacterized protein